MAISVYQQGGFGTTALFPSPVTAPRDPTINDRVSPSGQPYQVFQGWNNNVTDENFLYQGAGVWILIAGTSSFPVTPFVVGPTGQAGYQTIQSAIDAAVVAGGVSQAVWVQPGTYVENLDFSGATALGVGLTLMGATALGDEGQLEIVGTHIPPLTGVLVIRNFLLSSPTAIFSSTDAGSAQLVLIDMELNVEDGYTFDLLNWTGTFELFDINPGIADDGGINNTGGASFFMFSAGLGVGTLNTMNLSGIIGFGSVNIGCPVNFDTGSLMQIDVCQFGSPVTFAGSAEGELNNCRFTGGTSAAITMSSGGSVQVHQALVQSTNNPAIDGTAAGTLTLGDILFSNDSNISSGLIVAFVTALQGPTSVNGNLSLDLPSTQLQVEGGSVTDFIGQVVLGGGTFTIANTNIAATDKIFLQREGIGAPPLGVLDTTIVAGVSFTIDSLDVTTGLVIGGDVSTVNYFIVRQL